MCRPGLVDTRTEQRRSHFFNIQWSGIILCHLLDRLVFLLILEELGPYVSPFLLLLSSARCHTLLWKQEPMSHI